MIKIRITKKLIKDFDNMAAFWDDAKNPENDIFNIRDWDHWTRINKLASCSAFCEYFFRSHHKYCEACPLFPDICTFKQSKTSIFRKWESAKTLKTKCKYAAIISNVVNNWIASNITYSATGYIYINEE